MQTPAESDKFIYFGGHPHSERLERQGITARSLEACVRTLTLDNVVLLDAESNVNRADHMHNIGEAIVFFRRCLLQRHFFAGKCEQEQKNSDAQSCANVACGPQMLCDVDSLGVASCRSASFLSYGELCVRRSRFGTEMSARRRCHFCAPAADGAEVVRRSSSRR